MGRAEAVLLFWVGSSNRAKEAAIWSCVSSSTGNNCVSEQGESIGMEKVYEKQEYHPVFVSMLSCSLIVNLKSFVEVCLCCRITSNDSNGKALYFGSIIPEHGRTL